jgi:hypothetical protein
MLAPATGALPALALAATGPANSQTQVAYRHLLLAVHLVKWGVPVLGTGATVTYAAARDEQPFRDARTAAGIGPIDELIAASAIDRTVFEAELEAALSTWSSVADIAFLPSTAPEADIRIGAETETRGRAFTNVAYQAGDGGGAPTITRSLICLNPIVVGRSASTAISMSMISATRVATRSVMQSGSIIRAARGRSWTSGIGEWPRAAYGLPRRRRRRK